MISLGSSDNLAKTKLETFISETMRTYHIYGLSVCIVHDSKIIYSRGFGSRSIDPPLAATPDTLYGIGSSTKFFTVLGILKLVEQGKIDLSDPVEKYIKNFSAGSNGHPVTIHQLLSHSTGFPNLGMAEELLGRSLGGQTLWNPLGTIDDLVNLINEARNERVSTKGDVFMYWNEGYALLGHVIEEVSGKSYRDFITKNILLPLEMKRATFDTSKLESDKDAMVGFKMEKDGRRAPQKFPSNFLNDPAGGLLTSVNELSHMVSMLIGEGKYKGNRFINKELLEKAFTPHVQNNWPPSMGIGTYYGYGLSIDKNYFGHLKIGHSGNVAVSSAYFGFVPDLKIGVAVAANSDFNAILVGDYALSVATGNDPEKLPSVVFKRKAEILMGRYETFNGTWKLKIALMGANLTGEVAGEGEPVLRPLLIEGDDVFVLEGPDKVRVDVKIHSPASVDIRFERMLFHKVGR